MSGLKNVLGNVYGDSADRPQNAKLDDVKESMDALLEHAEEAIDEPFSIDDLDASDKPSPTALVEELDDVEESDDLDEPEATYDPFADEMMAGDDDVAFEESHVDGGDPDDPWALIDDALDETPDEAPVAEAVAEVVADTEPVNITPAPTVDQPSADPSWLEGVDADESGDDWLNEYDETGWTGTTDTDELDELDEAPDPTQEPTGFDDLEIDVPAPAAVAAVPQADAPVLDEEEEAWLDDLFTVAADESSDAEPTDTLDDEESDPEWVEPGPAVVQAAAPAAHIPPYTAPEPVQVPHFTPPTAVPFAAGPLPAPTGGFHAGWARLDDDILPSKKAGRSRRKSGPEIAIEVDTAHLNRGVSHDSKFIGPSSSETFSTVALAPIPAPIPAMHPGMASLPTQANGPLDASDPVHLFAPDEELEAASKKGRRLKKAPKAEKIRAEKAPRAEKIKGKGLGGRSRGRKNNDGNLDSDMLLAQVDAAIAQTARTQTAHAQVSPVASGDDFWADTPAAPVTEPQGPLTGLADPLAAETIQPPAPPAFGMDPGPVLGR